VAGEDQGDERKRTIDEVSKCRERGALLSC
jgi:hypothetical protein